MSPSAKDIAMVAGSGLFDFEWYRKQYPEVKNLNAAVAHYLDAGTCLDRDPSPEFGSRHYRQAYPDVAAAGINPLLHYLQHGQAEGRRRFSTHEPLPDDVKDQLAAHRALIAGTALFDADHYLETYPDIKNSGTGPLLHYLEHGAAEGREPNPFFDTRYYQVRHIESGDGANPLVHYLMSADRHEFDTSLRFDGRYYRARYPDADGSGLTPLDHFLRHGLQYGRRGVFASSGEPGTALPKDLRAITCTVVVPVHNAVSEVAKCLDALLRHTCFGGENSLLVIDDASTEAGIEQVLRPLDGRPGIRVLRQLRNLGYTRTANHGLELAGSDDVVLLNSDTMVGPHWLRRLKATAASHARIGTVTAVSNAAGEFSVPKAGNFDPPELESNDAVARAVEDAGGLPFEVPTGNGFCLYLKRRMIEQVGSFDEAAFPEGYGEENDLCMRAGAAGWVHCVDPSVYVRHRRSASFGERRDALAEAGFQRVCERYPNYQGVIGAISQSPGFIEARYRIHRQLRRLAAGHCPPRPRILYVISTRVGGTPQTNADLMRAVAGEFDAYALVSDGRVLELLRANEEGYEAIERIALSEPLRFASHDSLEYSQVVRALMLRWGIDLLHVRHLAWHGLSLIDAANELGIPVVMSFHDYYCVCPSVHLLDEHGGFHPQGVAMDAPNPLWHHDPTRLPMTPARLLHWQERMQQALSGVSAFVTTSPAARSLIGEALPGVAERADAFHVIPHGRDFERFLPGRTPVRATTAEPLRVLLPGNLSAHKGVDLLRALKALDSRNQIELHVLGNCPPGLADVVVDHGAYQREEFLDRAQAIAPDVAAILSVWPETFCHTLTECWAAGLPVIGMDIGAVGERIREHGGGWLLDFPASPEALYHFLLRLLEEPDDCAKRLMEVRRWQVESRHEGGVAKMATKYIDVYRGCLSAGFHAPDSGLSGHTGASHP